MSPEDLKTLTCLVDLLRKECAALDWDNAHRQRIETALNEARPVLDALASTISMEEI